MRKHYLLLSLMVISLGLASSCKLKVKNDEPAKKETQNDPRTERNLAPIQVLNQNEKAIAGRLCRAINNKVFHFFPRFINHTFRYNVKQKHCSGTEVRDELIDFKLTSDGRGYLLMALGPANVDFLERPITHQFDLRFLCEPLLSNPNISPVNTNPDTTIQVSFYESNSKDFARVTYFRNEGVNGKDKVAYKRHTLSLITERNSTDVTEHGLEQEQIVSYPCNNNLWDRSLQQTLHDF